MAVLAYVGVRRYVPWLLAPEALRAWVESFGIWAPVAFIALQAAQVVVAPIPGQVVVLLGGYLFGTLAGTAYSLVGAAIGSTVVFWLTRTYGRSYVERVITPAVLDQFDRVPEDNALAALFVGFLVPGLPDDVLCFAAGMTEIPLWKLVVVSFVGRIPSYLFVSYVGVELANENLVTAVALLVVFTVLAVLSYRYRDRFVGRFAV